MIRLSLIAIIFFLGGCSIPHSVVKTGQSQSNIAIKGAPADAVLFIDGLSMGLANQYDGNPKVLVVEEGLHQLSIQRNGIPLHAEKVFLNHGETKIFNINTGGK
jgi:hypothetical protein